MGKFLILVFILISLYFIGSGVTLMNLDLLSYKESGNPSDFASLIYHGVVSIIQGLVLAIGFLIISAIQLNRIGDMREKQTNVLGQDS